MPSAFFLFLIPFAVVAYNPLNTLHANNQQSSILHIDKPYGFGPYATANLTASRVWVGGKVPPEGYGVYFFLRRYYDQSDFAVDYEKALSYGDCLLAEPQPTDIVLNVSDQTQWDGTFSLKHEFTEEDQGLYFLVYQRCKPEGNRVKTSFTFTHQFNNIDRYGNVDYLSAGEQPLPTMYTTFCFIYIALTAAWVTGIKRAKKEVSLEFRVLSFFFLESQKKKVAKSYFVAELPCLTVTQRQSSERVAGGNFRQSELVVHHIHHMMTVLLIFKSLTLFTDFGRYHYISTHGTGEVWAVFYYIFTFCRGIMLFVIILLIGSGWSFLKPFLNDKEKKIIFFVLILQVIDNIFLVAIASDEKGSSARSNLENFLHLVDIICCCAILFPIVWQVRSLENVIGEGGSKAEERTIEKLTLFRQFYVLVIVYIYFTRILVFLVATLLTFKHAWLSNFFEEGGTLIFYVMVGWKFRSVRGGGGGGGGGCGRCGRCGGRDSTRTRSRNNKTDKKKLTIAILHNLAGPRNRILILN